MNQNNQSGEQQELTPVQWMDKAVKCLYLELPASIARDISDRWEAAKQFLSPPPEVKGGIKKEIDVLRKALKEDKEYYYSWQANIAVAFQDEYTKEFGDSDKMRVFVHQVSNAAAKRFLDQLIGNE